MATKSTRYMDNQGRIIIPNHIRKALNLAPGNAVSVVLDNDGTIRIRATEERCCICGESVDGKHFTQIATGANRKLVCYYCAQQIAREMLK
ncbi:MAG: AbrB/MazE/SpoVT family DNA-binding domain-containing protein [Oscillospiraceae bacterium]|nr:AbrB/MazE/SpoVT family DNA-binding domain-containing protein [Oscillospiraceae bacterium]